MWRLLAAKASQQTWLQLIPRRVSCEPFVSWEPLASVRCLATLFAIEIFGVATPHQAFGVGEAQASHPGFFPVSSAHHELC